MSKLKLSDHTEATLRDRARSHNNTGSSRRITGDHLKAVYRRGATMYAAQTEYADLNAFAMMRVEAYLDLLAHDNPAHASYKYDFDLLPPAHPLVASGSVTIQAPKAALEVEQIPQADIASPEHAIFNLAELSGHGYEIIPALRAAWRRGVNDTTGLSPYSRAFALATDPNSPDTDLLPRK